jgi:polysaccharide biosynthesis protein PslH
MMRALVELGHEVSLITRTPPAAEAVAGIFLAYQRVFLSNDDPGANGRALHLSGLQERFRSYWGIRTAHIMTVGRLAEECRADAVVVVGLNVLPYLAEVKDACRIWYAADEWVWHHLSQVRAGDRSSWDNVRDALIKGLYERAYGPLLERIWVVTETDRRVMRWITGQQAVDVIPNGVDGAHYRPMERAQGSSTCTFWGRLDFGPNIQALEWFCRHVWPQVRRKVPEARFTIYGFQPTPAVTRLAGQDGIVLVPDLPDLRAEIGRHQVVVLPFVSGGGIKNKLLEAASMGKVILCTPHACGGLRLGQQRPFIVAQDPAAMTHHLLTLWKDAALRQRLGQEARDWVLAHHSWQVTARTAVVGLEHGLAARS